MGYIEMTEPDKPNSKNQNIVRCRNYRALKSGLKQRNHSVALFPFLYL